MTKSRRLSTTRRILLALAIVPAAWLIVFASGYGKFIGRATLRVGTAEGGTVTCRYVHAAGIHERIAFTSQPDTVLCPQFISVRGPVPMDDVHWASALPTDRSVQLECRFIRYPVDGDSGLGTRFTGDAPLRIAVNFSAGAFELLDAGDQTLLGQPAPIEGGPNKSAAILMQFQRGTLPIFTGDKPGRLTLMILSADGEASMNLVPPQGALLWSRQGGCRPSEKRASL